MNKHLLSSITADDIDAGKPIYPLPQEFLEREAATAVRQAAE